MGTLLDTSNKLNNNVLDMIDNMMNSPFNKFLNETPILVEYYNINDLYSTTDTGLGTIDSDRGGESPTRFNKIKDFPLYGLKGLIPDLSEIEGDLYDLSIEGEVTSLPNTIRPTPGDYFSYKFLSRSIVFQINDVQLTTIQSNSYYKLTISMKAIDDDKYDKVLDKQVVETFNTDLETVGTNVKCIIKSNLFEKIKDIESKVERLRNLYVNTFYDRRYNSIIFRDGLVLEVNLYDQYLTHFIQNNAILKGTDCLVLINYDNRHTFRNKYNSTFFRNIETKSKDSLSNRLLYSPESLPTIHNPFMYYGEEVFFCLDLYSDNDMKCPKNEYFDNKLIYDILTNKVGYERTLIEAIIIRYLNGDILDIINDDELLSLGEIWVDYSRENLYYIPIVLYILDEYIAFLKHN